MRKPLLALLTCLVFLVFADRAVSGEETLKILIEKALQNNPALGAMSSNKKAAYSSARASGALPDPMLSIAVVNLPVNSFSLDETPMSGVGVGLSQRIPWPGKLGDHTDLANIGYHKADVAEREIRNRIVREVSQSYYEYSYWTESGRTLEEYLELLKGARLVAETRYANGEATAQDVIRVGSMLSRAEIRLHKMEQMGYSALLDLRRTVSDSFAVENLPAYLPDPNKAEFNDLSIESNPLIQKARLTVEQWDIQRRLAGKNYYPDFTIGVDYRIRDKIAGDPVEGADYMTFKIGLNIPLWFFAKQKHQLRSAEYHSMASRENERSLRDALETELNNQLSYLDFTFRSADEYANSIIPEAEIALEAAVTAYEVGQIDFDALLAAQIDLVEIRLEFLDLLRQFNQTVAVLKELAGVSYER
jgi:outer membrane protein TolC